MSGRRVQSLASWAYVMSIGWDSGLYKIGCCQNPNQRYKTLKHGNPELRIIAAEKLGPVQSYACEQSLHKHFSGQRHEGEIFELSPDQLAQAIAYIKGFTVDFSQALEGIPN